MRHIDVFILWPLFLIATGCASLGLDNDWVENPSEEEPLRHQDWSSTERKPSSLKKKPDSFEPEYNRYHYQEPKPVHRPWTDQYLGKKGYLVRPPFFANRKEAKKFDRCKPIEIVGFEKQREKGRYILIAQQGHRTLRIRSVDRKSLELDNNKRVTQLDQHFVGQLHFLDQKRHRASVGENLCDGRLWKHMPKDFFLFISGKPDEVRPGKGEYKGVEQWVYKSKRGGKEQSYYFNNGSLWAWTD